MGNPRGHDMFTSPSLVSQGEIPCHDASSESWLKRKGHPSVRISATIHKHQYVNNHQKTCGGFLKYGYPKFPSHHPSYWALFGIINWKSRILGNSTYTLCILEKMPKPSVID